MVPFIVILNSIVADLDLDPARSEFFYPMCFRDTSVAYGQQITVPFGVEGQWLQVQKKDKYKISGDYPVNS